jgi:hypothetical protein
VDDRHPNGLPYPLLQVACVLDHRSIPEELFRSIPVYLWLYDGEHADVEITEDDVRSALRSLAESHLITVDAATDMIEVDPALPALMLRELGAAKLKRLVRAAADGLAEVWPDNAERIGDAAHLRRHVEALYRHDRTTLLRPGIHDVLTTAAQSRGEDGDAAEAAAMFGRWADDAGALGGTGVDIVVARVQATFWQSRHRPTRDAAESIERLLPDLVRVLGPRHADTLAAKGRVAELRGSSGDLAGATALWEQLLADHERVFGPGHHETIETRGRLAHWRGMAGDVAGAEATFAEVQDELEWAFGYGHRRTLAARGDYAQWRSRRGDPVGAVRLLEAVLGDQQRILGSDHPDVRRTRERLAQARSETGDPAEQGDNMMTWTVLRLLPPEMHLGVMSVGHAAEEPDDELGEPAEPLEAQRRVLAEEMAASGPDRPDVMTTRHNLAELRGRTGDPAGAAAEFEALLADRIRVLGPDHPDTLANRGTLIDCRGRLGDPAGAAGAAADLVADCSRALGPDHPLTFSSRSALATWRGRAGDPAAAAAGFTALLADQTRVLGPDHPETLVTRGNIAGWLGAAGDAATAAARYAELLVDRLRVLGPGHPATLLTQRNAKRWHGEARTEDDR